MAMRIGIRIVINQERLLIAARMSKHLNKTQKKFLKYRRVLFSLLIILPILIVLVMTAILLF